jgi:hypothetical protein
MIMKKTPIRTSALKPEDFASLSLRQAVVHLKAGNRLWVLRAASGEGDVFSAEDPWAEIKTQLGLTKEAAQQEGWTMLEVKPRDVKPLLQATGSAQTITLYVPSYSEAPSSQEWWDNGGWDLWIEFGYDQQGSELTLPADKARELIRRAKEIRGWSSGPRGQVRPFRVVTNSTRSRKATTRTAEDAAPVPPAEKKEEGETTTPAVKAESHQYGSLSKKLSTAVGPALSEILGEFGPELYNGVVTSIKGALKTAFEATLEQVENTVKEELGAQGLKVAQQYYRSWLDELTADLKQHGFDDASVAVEDIASDLAAAFPTEQAADENVPDLGEMKPAGEEEDLMPVEETPDLEPVDLAPPTPEVAPTAPATPAPAAPAAPAGAGPVDLLAPTADFDLQPRKYRRRSNPVRR